MTGGRGVWSGCRFVECSLTHHHLLVCARVNYFATNWCDYCYMFSGRNTYSPPLFIAVAGGGKQPHLICYSVHSRRIFRQRNLFSHNLMRMTNFGRGLSCSKFAKFGGGDDCLQLLAAMRLKWQGEIFVTRRAHYFINCILNSRLY